MNKREDKTKMMKRFKVSLLAAALGMSVSTASAVGIDGTINFGGGLELIGGDLADATGVDWVDPPGDDAPQVVSSFGDMAGIVAGTPVDIADPWIFNPSTSYDPFWSVGGFTFALDSVVIDHQNDSFLSIAGTGTMKAAGFDDTDGVWFFSTQGIPSGGVFSWSANAGSAPVSDGGATVPLFGLALLSLPVLRRKLVS